MSDTWYSEDTPPEPKPTGAGWLLFALRAVPFLLICGIGLVLLLLVRLVERPLCGERRPVTPWFQRTVCRAFFAISGIRLKVTGQPMRQRGAMVANHVSWSDIFTLSAPRAVFFVSKSEVAGWPGIGVLAKATGTVFINRNRAEAKVQEQIFRDRLLLGQTLMFFPEGTSTDGRRVLPFKSSLFAAFFAEDLREVLWIQPVTTLYRPPEGAEPRFYGWWGDMEFGAHLAKVLGTRRQGSVEVIYHAPLKVSDFRGRKELAAAAEAVVRGGMPWDFQQAR
ncbi:1-acyl-sn-glycerol-3-phosphate acyltransferase [Pseudooceanicola sp. CBS1P-1]|uniref:1-acyl-sn-glycerol-3-phosphate acyltransferase n=1 Tax=Pseudooceanicola albus TaxID=2692189 RepID=A0A6L7FYM1_9RHOB|nr:MULTISPECIES: lysophospholipid acyltransferase family protein [Pseudooceanicola]MBT9383277.1 1-acyl-sn-glycerol-3-phosphate acyltransferase [Pseudooceanicola endophyticus]MXN16400.1 1-acyl-sn-glycerol-3-phosphate acyltransferase [Pseudooceanicola albus]